MPQDPFDDIVRGYDQQLAPPKLKPAKSAKKPSFDDLVKDVDGQPGSVSSFDKFQYPKNPRVGQTVPLRGGIKMTYTGGTKEPPTLSDARMGWTGEETDAQGRPTGRMVHHKPKAATGHFQSPIDLRLNAPNEAQKAFDRAAEAVKPAPIAPKPELRTKQTLGQMKQRARNLPPTTQEDILRNPITPEERKASSEQFLTEQALDKQRQQAAAKAKLEEEASRASQSTLGKMGTRFARGAVRGVTQTPFEFVQMANPDPVVRQTMGRIADDSKEWQSQNLPVDNRNPATLNVFKPEFYSLENVGKAATENIPEVLGEMLPQMALARGAGGAARLAAPELAAATIPRMASTTGAQLAARTAAGGYGAAQQSTQAYQKALAAGMTHEQAQRAAAIEAPIGFSEFLGSPGTTGFTRPGGTILREMREEGLQELGQTAASGLAGKYASGYDADKSLTDIAGESLGSGLLGAATGGIVAAPGARLQARQQANQQRAARSAIDQRSAANAAAITPQPAQAQPVTEPLTEPLAAQPSAPVTPQAQPQGFPRLPEPENFNARRAKLLGMPVPAEVRLNEQIAAAAQLLDSTNEGDQRQGRRMLNKALTDLRKAEGYLAEAQMPPDAERPFTAVRDAIEGRLSNTGRAKNSPSQVTTPESAQVQSQQQPTASNALRAEADAAKIKAAEFERVGDFTQAAATYQAAHQNLKRLRRSMGQPKTPEAVAQINQIDREISIADANRRKANQAARTAQRQANAPTTPLSKELSKSQKPNAQVPLNQVVESAPLLRPDAVQNPEGGIPQMPEPTFTDRLESAARRDEAARGKAKPAKRLLSRIAELGGISDRYAGELQDVKDARRIGVIRQKAEMSPDVLARQLQSEGYDVDPEDLNTLWEAARRDIAGRDERTSQTSELERRLAEEEAAYNERQPFDEIVADVDVEFQPDTADLREVREFGKRPPQTQRFTEEPPTAPLARRREPIRPPAPASPRQVGNRPLSVDVAGTRTPVAMSPEFPRARREMVKQGREVEARLTEGQDKGEFGNVAEAMFKSNTPDVLHGQDSFFHDPDLKGKLGLTRDAEMADVRRELKTQLARSLGLSADEVSLSHIKPEVWRAWAKQKGLGREAVRKLEAGIARAERKQRATETNAAIVAEESQRAQSEVREPAAKELWQMTPEEYARSVGVEKLYPGFGLDASIMQLNRMSNRERSARSKERASKQSAYNDTVKQWEDAVWEQYQKGAFFALDVWDTDAFYVLNKRADMLSPFRLTKMSEAERVKYLKEIDNQIQQAAPAKSIDAQIKDIRDLQKFGLIDDKEAKQKIAALEAQRPKIAERREAQPRTREDVENSPEFKRWFGDSKVVDKDGKPLVMYHGTDVDFESFDASPDRRRFPYTIGLHFTTSPEEASVYASGVRAAAYNYKKNESPGANVRPVYIQAQRPLTITTSELTASMEADLNRAEIISQLVNAKRAGNPYDSVIIKRERGDEYDGWNVIAFSPNQIKSAIGNRGTFDPDSAKITERRSEAMPERYTGRQLFENAQLTFRPARNRPATLVANDWGGAMLNRLLSEKLNVTTTDANFTIGAKDAKDLRDYLADAKDSGIYEPAQVANMDAMLKQMDAAIADAEANQQDVAFVTRRPAEPISATKAKIRHEAAHLSQSRIVADLSALTGKNWLDSQPNAKDIHKELDRRGYAPETHDYEAAAFVASGDYGVFGMNLDQAAKFLSDYFGAVVEKHGKRALRKFGAIDPKLQPTLEAQRETEAGRTENQRRSSEAAQKNERRIGAASETGGSRAGVLARRQESDTGDAGTPATGETGRRTRASVENSPEFKRWFGDSKVVDKNGKPLVVYHGTQSPVVISELDYSKLDPNALYGPGFYTTQDPNVAASDDGGYALNKGDNLENAHAYKLYLRIKNPLDINNYYSPRKTPGQLEIPAKLKSVLPSPIRIMSGQGIYEALVEEYGSKAEANLILQAAGFDGITHLGGVNNDRFAPRFKTFEDAKKAEDVRGGRAVALVPGDKFDKSLPKNIPQILSDNVDDIEYVVSGHRVWIAFYPEQIKSATGNRGTFDPTSPKITERKDSGLSPARRGQVLASGLGAFQNLFERDAKPKEVKPTRPVPLPRNFNLADWSQRLYRDAMAAGLPKDARAKYDAAKTVREKNVILMESKLDSARESQIFDLIDRAQAAAEKNDGSALYDVLSDATDLMRKTPERGLKRVKDEVGNLVSLPRAIMASMDVSAPLRQGAILTLPPTQWGSAAKATLRMFQSFSTAKYKQIGKQINLHEDAETARESGLYLSTDKSGLLTKKEEDFISGWADKIPLVKHSEQAYKTYLDSLRMDSFARYKKSIDKTKGLSEEQKQKAYQAAAEWINTATGRGSLGSHFESAMPILSKTLFAPRYAASRIQVLNPYTYAKNSRTPEGRAVLKNQMLDMVQYAGMVSLTLALASAAGATVGLDPEDPDFLKIKVGQTRYDVLAGLQQPMRLFYRLGAAVSDRLKGEKPERNQSVGDISKKFVRSKLAPVPSFLWDYFEAKDFIGRDFEMKRAVLDRVVPLMWKDMADAYEKEGGAGAAKILPAAFGIGVQNYAEKTGSLKESQFTDAAEKYGKAYDYVRPKVGEPEAVYKQRVERVEGWMSEYGDKLLSHPSYSLLTESQKQAAIENLRRRIGTQQNVREPKRDLFGNIESFAPEKVIQSVLKSEATRPKRDAGKLWSPPANRP